MDVLLKNSVRRNTKVPYIHKPAILLRSTWVTVSPPTPQYYWPYKTNMFSLVELWVIVLITDLKIFTRNGHYFFCAPAARISLPERFWMTIQYDHSKWQLPLWMSCSRNCRLKIWNLMIKGITNWNFGYADCSTTMQRWPSQIHQT